MGNIGEIAEAINASKVHLDLGGNRHILLQELESHISHPESREATDTGSVYFYGQSDDYFDATLLLSTPEMSTFLGYTILNGNGDLPTNSLDLIYSDKTGTATQTLNVECQIPDITWSKPVEGGVKTRMRFRITGGTISGGATIQATDLVQT
jgi:hypothetical protein